MTTDEVQLLSAEQQAEVLSLLYRGASPAAACVQIGVTVESFLKSIAESEEFRRRCAEVTDILTGNVTAMMYRGAMDGSVSAQQAWLKSFPKPPWQQTEAAAHPMTFDELLDGLSDDELAELARAMGIDLPHETQTDVDSP